MIHKIIVKNFLSFAEEQVVDFTVDDNAPNTEIYRTSIEGVRVTPLLGVLGANAHGKTNLICALSHFARFAVFSFGSKNKPFVFSAAHSCKKSEPIFFSIEFSNKKKIYRYELKLGEDKLISESFVELNGKKGRPPYLFKLERNENNLEISGDWVDEIKRECKEILNDAKTTSLLSLLTIGLKKKNVLSVVSPLLDISHYRSEADEDNIKSVSAYYKENRDVFEKVKNFMISLDTGIDDVDIKEIEKDDGNKEYYPRFSHRDKNDNSFFIGVGLESDGIKRLYTFLKEIFVALDTGGVLVCDELDRSMHPHMLDKFLSLFKSVDTNPKSAQLVFTTHEAYVLNLLDKEQIGFVEKTHNESSFFKLSDIAGVKARDNYFGKYMAGAYGAVPGK
jgi:AAA15 family ATPase/GTPase